MQINQGEKNEINFVKYLNNKKVKELNPMFLEFIVDLFGIVDENSIINCIKNK